MSESIVDVPVIDIEGIGPATADRLEAMGISSIVDFLRQDVQAIQASVPRRV